MRQLHKGGGEIAMKKLIAVVALLFVFGCASGPSPAVRHQGQVELANRLMVGRPYQEFVAMLGPPQSGMDDGSGGENLFLAQT
jgi:hypothetical protein